MRPSAKSDSPARRAARWVPARSHDDHVLQGGQLAADLVAGAAQQVGLDEEDARGAVGEAVHQRVRPEGREQRPDHARRT